MMVLDTPAGKGTRLYGWLSDDNQYRRVGGQEVYHFHIHVIGGGERLPGMIPVTAR